MILYSLEPLNTHTTTTRLELVPAAIRSNFRVTFRALRENINGSTRTRRTPSDAEEQECDYMCTCTGQHEEDEDDEGKREMCQH